MVTQEEIKAFLEGNDPEAAAAIRAWAAEILTTIADADYYQE